VLRGVVDNATLASCPTILPTHSSLDIEDDRTELNGFGMIPYQTQPSHARHKTMMSQHNGEKSQANIHSSSEEGTSRDFWLWVSFLATLPVPHIKKALLETISEAWKAEVARLMPFADEEWFPSSMRVPRDLYPQSRVGGGLHGPPQFVRHYLEDEYFTVYCGNFQRVVWEDRRFKGYAWPGCDFGYSYLHNLMKNVTREMSFPEYPTDDVVAKLPIPEILKDLHLLQDFYEPWFTRCCSDHCMWEQPHNFAHPDYDHLYTGCEEENGGDAQDLLE
jgi:hypothetical protein